MTTPIVHPILSVNKIFQNDTTGSQRKPLFQFFEPLTGTFTVPDIGDVASVVVGDSSNYAVGMFVYIPGAGFFEVSAIASTTTIYLLNTGASQNYSPGITVPATTPMIPCGQPANVPQTFTYQQVGQTASADTSAANDTLLVHVTYPVAFAVPPTAIVLQIESDTNLGTLVGAVALYVRNKDETGFDIYYSATGIFSLTVNWIAMI